MEFHFFVLYILSGRTSIVGGVTLLYMSGKRVNVHLFCLKISMFVSRFIKQHWNYMCFITCICNDWQKL